MSLANKIDYSYDHDLLEYLKTEFINYYGEECYNNWFAEVSIGHHTENKVEFLSGNNLVQKWILNNYIESIKNWCRAHNPSLQSIEFVDQTKSALKSVPQQLTLNTSVGLDSNILSSHLDRRFSFDNFVVGKPNELAYAASRAVAESPYAIPKSNPLFLYGDVGLGKTHLMHAIAWHIKDTNPNRKVVYMSAEKFMYEFVKALRTREVMSFKEYFRSVDVLMIDDIQFICGKDSTQEEFFHTFNALIDNNRQMVISCDRSPSDLDNIEDRIKSRLGWGLVADVHSTTYELRLGILQSKIEQLGVVVPQNVIEFLALKITSNVRELEGALNKVIAHSNLTSSSISLQNTQFLLRDLIRTTDKGTSVEEVQNKVAERYNIRVVELCSHRRIRNLARPRQIAMYLCKRLTTKSLVDIGKQFGKKDHTTVMHAIKTVEELINIDQEFAREVEMLNRIIQA